jgi:hypothetical protein
MPRRVAQAGISFVYLDSGGFAAVMSASSFPYSSMKRAASLTLSESCAACAFLRAFSQNSSRVETPPSDMFIHVDRSLTVCAA